MTLSRIALYALAATPFTLTAQSPVENYLPEDLSILVKVDNIADLIENSGEGPLAAILEDETIAEFLKPLFTSEGSDKSLAERFEEETDISLDELKKLFPKQAAFALDLTQFAESGFSDDVSPEDIGFYVILEHTNKDRVKEILDSDAFLGEATSEGRLRVVEDSFMDLTIHQLEDPETDENSGAYVVTDDLLILSTSVSALKEVVVKTKGESTLPSFSASSAAQALKSDYEGAEVKLYFQPKLAFRALEKMVTDGLASSEDDAAQSPLTPKPEAIFKALQLDSIGEITMGLDFQQDSIRMKSFLNTDFDRGIGRLFNAYRSEAPKPAFVPKEVASMDAMSFDLGAFWTELEGILMAAAPMVGGMYQGYLAQIQQGTGVDLRQALINNLGPAIVTYSMPMTTQSGDGATPPMQHMVIAFSVKDRLTLDQALNTLIGISGMGEMLQKRDYLGHQVTLIPTNPQTNQSAGFTITDGWFIVSTNSEDLLQALTRMEQEGQGSFWDNEAFQEGLGLLRSGGVSVSYRDVNELARIFLMMMAQGATAAQAQKQMEQALEEDPGKAFKPLEFDYSLLKELDLPFHLISKSYKTEDGILGDAIVFEKEED